MLASQLRKVRLPLVVGEIVAGIIVGQSGFDLIADSPELEFLTLFGFTYLMFISGLEVDFKSISIDFDDEVAKGCLLANPFIIGIIIFGLTLGLSLAAAEGLLYLGLIEAPFVMALILGTTSLGIVVPVLKERGLMPTTYGQTVLVTSLIADFGTLTLITVYVVIISQGLTLEVLLVLLLLAAFAVVVQVGRLVASIPGLPRLIEELSHATAQIKVRGAFALMVAFIVLSEWLGTEVILGAFLAGAVISLLSQGDGSDLHMKLDAIGFGFFIPIFFIMVGVQFHLPALLSSSRALLLVPLLLVIAYGVKFATALLYRFSFSWRETLGAGGLLSARLSLIIAAAAIALELGVINEAVDSAIILVAVVTCTLSPLIFNRILPDEMTEIRSGVILVGLSEISTLIADRLRREGEPVTLVGSDQNWIDHLNQRNLNLVAGDPTHPAILEAAQAETANALVALHSSAEVNCRVCQLAAEQFSIPHLIAQADNPQLAGKMAKRGVRVIQQQLAIMMAIEGALRFPSAFDMMADHADGVEIREVELSNLHLDGRRLRHINLPGDVLILGMRRNGELIIPRGDTKLRQGDLLMLIGHYDCVRLAIEQLSSD